MQARLLNSDAELNNFKEISALNYVPGENPTIVFRLFDEQLGIRFIPTAVATMTVDMINSDGTTLTKTPTVLDADDRSIWTFNLTDTETQALAGSNIQVNLDDNGDLKKAVIANALIKNVISGDC